MVEPAGALPNPSQVRLTDPRSARAQRITAWGVVVVGLTGGTVAVVFSDAWWQVALWISATLLVVLIGWGIGASASNDARETAALRATGVAARAEVLAAERVDDHEDVSYDLTLWITPPGGVGFQVEHRCDKLTCVTAAQRPTALLDVLVDPAVRTWGVVH
ncbi:hypothetical protein [Saccharothrix sp. HUAS TT1]|uniref:hypothetical protein n=1 Tax=unclassified Saccharothrix TaxID=2593673 RepID=UPI00345BA167